MAFENELFITPFGENIRHFKRRSFDGPAEYVTQDTLSGNRVADSIQVSVSPRGNPAKNPDQYVRRSTFSHRIAFTGPNGVVHNVTASLTVSVSGSNVVPPIAVREAISSVLALPVSLDGPSSLGNPLGGPEIQSTFVQAVLNQES